jgi:hypothetical protein
MNLGTHFEINDEYQAKRKKEDDKFIEEKVLEHERKEQNEIDKNIKLNHELYLQNQKANPDDTI